LDDSQEYNAGAAYIFGGLSDCNENGVLDICDISDGDSPDCNGNGTPDECDPPGDFDGDTRVDLADFAAFSACYTGSCLAPLCEPPLYLDVCCVLADFDLDGDVDPDDHRPFQAAMTGP